MQVILEKKKNKKKRLTFKWFTHARIKKFCQRGSNFNFLFFYFFDERRNDSNNTISGPSTGRQRNAIQMAFRWRADGGPTLMLACKLCGFYRRSGLILLRNPIFL